MKPTISARQSIEIRGDGISCILSMTGHSAGVHALRITHCKEVLSSFICRIQAKEEHTASVGLLSAESGADSPDRVAQEKRIPLQVTTQALAACWSPGILLSLRMCRQSMCRKNLTEC